jgi:4-hydroxyphenylacetate 3-monooxygenase
MRATSKNPDIDKYLARYVRGSNGIDYKERIKTMKLLDAVGTGVRRASRALRDELFRQRRPGADLPAAAGAGLRRAQGDGGRARRASRCMADYDEDGWRHPAYFHDGSGHLDRAGAL